MRKTLRRKFDWRTFGEIRTKNSKEKLRKIVEFLRCSSSFIVELTGQRATQTWFSLHRQHCYSLESIALKHLFQVIHFIFCHCYSGILFSIYENRCCRGCCYCCLGWMLQHQVLSWVFHFSFHFYSIPFHTSIIHCFNPLHRAVMRALNGSPRPHYCGFGCNVLTTTDEQSVTMCWKIDGERAREKKKKRIENNMANKTKQNT